MEPKLALAQSSAWPAETVPAEACKLHADVAETKPQPGGAVETLVGRGTG